MSIHAPTFPRPNVDPAVFADAMTHLASGVAVVTFWDGPTPRGLLISALTTLSTQPPRMLFGVDKTDSSHDHLLAAEECSLNLLSDSDLAEAERFSRNDQAHDRFCGEAWRIERGRPPARIGALVSLRGLVDRRIDAGSHSIFIIRVENAEVGQHAPLVYFGRGFHRLSDPPRPA